MRRGKLYIVRGIPGSGKTTYAKELCSKGEKKILVEGDMYRQPDDTCTYLYHESNYYDVKYWVCLEAKRWLQQGRDVVLTGTFIHQEIIDDWCCIIDQDPHQIIRCTGDYGSVHKVSGEHMDKYREKMKPIAGEKIIS